MTVTVKDNAPLIVPPSVRRKVGLKSGDKVVFRTDGRVITILPKEEPDDDEYTPAQRKIIDAGIAKGLAELARGDYIEFRSAAELSAWIEAGIAKKRMRKKRK
jgi:AbrB family looped-hinge helix DNA binding protein